MADLTSHHQMIEALCTRVKAHVAGLESLANALAREGEYLARRHQACQVVALQRKIMREVEWTRLAEDEALSDFTWKKKNKASAHHVAGIALAFLYHDSRHLQRNCALAEIALSRTAPFGTVAVQVAPPGVPDGVTIVSLSRMARQGWTSESDIRARFEAKGCRLIEPAVLIDVLNRLEQDVLDGSAVLPLACEQLGVYLTSRAPKAETALLPAPIPWPRLLLPGSGPKIRSANHAAHPG